MSTLSTEDRLAIGEVLAAYCHHLDAGRWEALRALFTADCRLDFGALLGTFEGREGLERFTATLARIGVVMRHYTTNVVVTGDGSAARAQSYVLGLTGASGTRAIATGRYEDELVKQDGRWLIRVRRAIIET
jgi:hypothetical protein